MSATVLRKSNSEGEGESQFEAKITKSFNLEFSVAFSSRRFWLQQGALEEAISYVRVSVTFLN